MEDKSQNAANHLQAIIEEQNKKLEQAEKLQQALVEEFTSCNDFDDVRKKFRENVKDIAPMAITNIIDLMNNAESESVRSSLNKWVLEWVMSDKIDQSAGDVANLLKELKTNDDKVPSE